LPGLAGLPHVRASARSMSCKVSSGMLGRIFQSGNGSSSSSSWTSRVQALCHDLIDTIGTPEPIPTSAVKPVASTEQVRSCLQAAIGMFEEAEKIDAEKSELLRGLLDVDLPARMLGVLSELDFEARKDVMRLFNLMLQLGTLPLFDYVRTNGRIIELILDGCGNDQVALHCNMMLRSCTRHSELVVCLLEARPHDLPFSTGLLKLTRSQTFDISSDAFSSLRELLLTHKATAAAHLEKNFREFFVPYNELLQAEDYVTKRQALRLLGEILLDRCFMRVMLSYVSDEQFLQIHMNLLRDDSKAIQADAFHVFKIFAANPNKPLRVHQILLKNRERLVKLLDKLGKEGDESFAQDRKAVVQALRALEAQPANAATSSGKPAGSADTSPVAGANLKKVSSGDEFSVDTEPAPEAGAVPPVPEDSVPP